MLLLQCLVWAAFALLPYSRQFGELPLRTLALVPALALTLTLTLASSASSRCEP